MLFDIHGAALCKMIIIVDGKMNWVVLKSTFVDQIVAFDMETLPILNNDPWASIRIIFYVIYRLN